MNNEVFKKDKFKKVLDAIKDIKMNNEIFKGVELKEIFENLKVIKVNGEVIYRKDSEDIEFIPFKEVIQNIKEDELCIMNN